MKLNFRVVDVVVSDEHVRSFIKYDFKTKKVKSQSSNVITDYLGTFSTDKCVLYSVGLYNLG